jgi:hypothetical protein
MRGVLIYTLYEGDLAAWQTAATDKFLFFAGTKDH